MAVVLLAVNGMGLGHLIRSTIISNALASVGERPVIFSEGKYHPGGLARFPVRLVPSLWAMPDQVRKRVASELNSMAGISLPAVVVEDTHPNPIQLPALIRRVLLVRPTSFEFLIHLKERYGEVYSAYLLCDSPDSPTWPYDEDQTRQLAAWEKWHFIGPVYRSPSDDEIRDVRKRNALSDDEEVCVFTMGGGGVHIDDPKAQDIIRFLRLSLKVADVVQPPGSRVRLLFVLGPYFPPRLPIPSRFEVVQEEAQMPALLKIAKGAVIRAGFNTTWECIAAGTPFFPLIGTTYAEPVAERLNRLTSQGLVPPDIESFWFDEKWRSNYGCIAKNVVAAHSGVPEARNLSRLILDRRRTRSLPSSKPLAIRERGATRGIPLVIRIDDAVCTEPAFCWLLDLLAARGLRASLEVVPYLVQFDEAFLDRFDPSGALFEVSQHGYAHIPHTSLSGRLFEFSPESAEPTPQDVEAIAWGKRQIEKAFPKRFAGGFSPPFDALPGWLPATWHELGGAFVSCIATHSAPGAPLRVVRAGVEDWDWTADRPFPQETMTHNLALQLAMDGYLGLVLHPECLRNRSDKSRLVVLLNHLEQDAQTASLRDVALGRVEAATPVLRLGRLRSSLHEKRLQRSHE